MSSRKRIFDYQIITPFDLSNSKLRFRDQTGLLRDCPFLIVYSWLLCPELSDDIFMCIYFWALYSIPLICMSVSMPILCYFDYYNFVMYEIKEYDVFSFVLFQDCYEYSGSYMVLQKFQNCSISVKNVIGILIEITLYLYIALNSINIITLLILLVHEHGISFYLFVTVVLLINVLQFSIHMSLSLCLYLSLSLTLSLTISIYICMFIYVSLSLYVCVYEFYPYIHNCTHERDEVARLKSRRPDTKSV